MKKKALLTLILSLAAAVPAYASPQATLESYEKDGLKYIEKTYVIGGDESISDVADSSFEVEGYLFHQIDIKNEPIIEVETKEVEQLEKVSVSGQRNAEILRKLGETIAYADEDGFEGELKPDLDNVRYYVSGYTSKTMTKNGSQMYYNLTSMDTSQIPKSIWRDGISLKLMDIQWIGDNRSASADTAVGNNFAAKGIYKGTYQVNIPSGYTAEVMYKGTAEKKISEQIAYTVTYVGEEIESSLFENMSLPILIGFLLLDVLLIAAAVYLIRRLRKKQLEDAEEFMEEDSTEDGKEEGI